MGISAIGMRPFMIGQRMVPGSEEEAGLPSPLAPLPVVYRPRDVQEEEPFGPWPPELIPGDYMWDEEKGWVLREPALQEEPTVPSVPWGDRPWAGPGLPSPLAPLPVVPGLPIQEEPEPVAPVPAEPYAPIAPPPLTEPLRMLPDEELTPNGAFLLGNRQMDFRPFVPWGRASEQIQEIPSPYRPWWDPRGMAQNSR